MQRDGSDAEGRCDVERLPVDMRRLDRIFF